MPCPRSIEHALLKAAMWTRLARQCRRCGDLEMEKEALTLARRHLGRAAGDRVPAGTASRDDPVDEADPPSRRHID